MPKCLENAPAPFWAGRSGKPSKRSGQAARTSFGRAARFVCWRDRFRVVASTTDVVNPIATLILGYAGSLVTEGRRGRRLAARSEGAFGERRNDSC